MNLLTIIFVTLLLFSLTDFMWPEQKKLHKQLYYLALFLTYFLFTIKYYYGADILSYVIVYDSIESPSHLWKYGSEHDGFFEFGYLLFCSVLNHWGVSFWWMTAIVSTLYFYTINKLFGKLPSKKIFALFILVLLDYHLIFATYRQCIAVSCFILMVLAYVDRKYVRTVIYFLIVSSVHKSGFYVAAVTLSSLVFFGNYKASKTNYWLLAVVLLLLCVISTKDLLMPLVQYLPLSSSSRDSILHHFSLERKIQVVFLTYFITISLIGIYQNRNSSQKTDIKLQWVVFVGLFIIVFFYQYYYLLNRLRSYFLPFIIVYVIRLIYSEKQLRFVKIKNIHLVNQISVCLLYIILTRFIIVSHNEQKAIVSKIYESSTIFDLRNKSEKEIKREQLRKARLYWKVDVDRLLNEGQS